MDFKLYCPGAMGDEAARLMSAVSTFAYEYKPSFLTLWRDVDDIHVAFDGDDMFVERRALDSFLMPISENLPRALEKLKEHCKENNQPLRLSRVPKEWAHFLRPEEFVVTGERGLWDYIYPAAKLTSLSGKHLQAKRNHISQFMRAYPDPEVVELTPGMRAECLEMDARWTETHQLYSKEVTEERMAIERAFDFFDELGLFGVAVRVEGRLAAFTIAEKVPYPDEIVVHFEKADTDYIGIYSVIGHELAVRHFQGAAWVNRQEDVGLEGLRKSKLSYHPEFMQEKVSACLR